MSAASQYVQTKCDPVSSSNGFHIAPVSHFPGNTKASKASEWLAHIADMLGAEASGKLSMHPDGRHSLITNDNSNNAISQYRDHFSRLDPLPQLLKERPAGRAIVINTTRHPAYQALHELCTDYLQPHGIDHVIATQWQQADGTRHVVGVQRFHGSEPFSAGQGQELEHRCCLTRAEAELTVLLAQGESPESIASARAVKLDTVRTQLRTVYQKTGTHRQGELVCLVGMLGNG